jgi:hypothetical protein
MASKKKTHFELMRAKILRERRKKLQLTKFKPEEKSIRGRVTEFLLWCADHYPHCIVTYEEITQAIFGLGRVPDSRSKHVKSVRGQMSSCGKLLLGVHSKTLITCRGVGARASVDHSDKARESLPDAAKNYQRAAEKLRKVAESIDQLELAAELKELVDPQLRQELSDVADWHKELINKVIKNLKKPTHVQALLPPPPQA